MRPQRGRGCALVALIGCLLPACASLSVGQEQQLGEQLAWEARGQHRFLNDPVTLAYVQRIGEKVLAAAGPQPFEYHFEIIDDEDINAFAGPAGWIYLHTGTILRTRNVSELASVIAHEVGHVALRHIAENYARVRAANLGHQTFVALASIVGYGSLASVTGGWAALGLINSFGREAEEEADAFAVRVMPLAGYDPGGLVSFFHTMLLDGTPQSGGFLSSHPATTDRIDAARELIAAQALPPDLRSEDSGRLEIIQRRIQLLTGGGRAPPVP